MFINYTCYIFSNCFHIKKNFYFTVIKFIFEKSRHVWSRQLPYVVLGRLIEFIIIIIHLINCVVNNYIYIYIYIVNVSMYIYTDIYIYTFIYIE